MTDTRSNRRAGRRGVPVPPTMTKGADVFDFIETIRIDAPARAIWDALQELDTWWLPSNPEHDSIERLDDLGNNVGARLRIRERIAGIPGTAVGVITHVKPGSEVTWQADQATYRWLGTTITISEGVTWRVEPVDTDTCDLSACVWATFPESWLGRFVAWAFEHLLDGIAKDRRHARRELEYLKNSIGSSNH